ncbi:hypothetical protein SUGI_0805640 [Cryptomeria japonica]|nr:hypothetical protein SUGI_0805640 [Cryptomeria japonica]
METRGFKYGGAVLVFFWLISSASTANTKFFHFNVQYANITRLCHSKSLLTVNGQYPGPNIAITEGDNVVIKVSNHVKSNTTLHWHGIRQIRTAWADGPAYVTQCPIQRGHSYTYKFRVTKQRGTLWWHAHISWQRASVHGAFIIYPKKTIPYPFPKPDLEVPIIFGEWWNEDVEGIEKDIIQYGGGPNVSEAYTINGLPGSLYPCSNKDTFVQKVESGKTYLLRLINAALNDELFFAIANHTMTVVEIDASYTKPFTTEAVMITPGQTMNVLVTANQRPAKYHVAACPYVTSKAPFDETRTTALWLYSKPSLSIDGNQDEPVVTENLPVMRDTAYATKFTASLRSLNSRDYPSNDVPKKIDREFLFTISLGLQDCPRGKICKGYYGGRFSASMNNQSFVRPLMAMLQAAYYNMSGVFSKDFPAQPPRKFNYTDNLLSMNMNPQFGSRIAVVNFNDNVEIVLQDTSLLSFENHPIHLHGFNFYVVGNGFGNFDPEKDRAAFNLVDPPLRNTVAVPSAGWTALRFKADNPGVWFLHCHLEIHTTWGLATAIMVENGPGPGQSILPPPNDLPPC